MAGERLGERSGGGCRNGDGDSDGGDEESVLETASHGGSIAEEIEGKQLQF